MLLNNSVYYWCYEGVPHLEVCPPGTVWNQGPHICDWPQNVDTSNCNMPARAPKPRAGPLNLVREKTRHLKGAPVKAKSRSGPMATGVRVPPLLQKAMKEIP
ncbi:chitinase 1 precursor [Penaeus vannamei]|uniref:Chitinase 1 n=1 Tax=Penaeus vannamei TaxID=6689 RepID=A0A3R7QHX0_PENVA|nr:chitinase 1 precursor [Penaeus vannamei]